MPFWGHARCCCEGGIVESNCPSCTFGDPFNTDKTGWGSGTFYTDSGRLKLTSGSPGSHGYYLTDTISITPTSGEVWTCCVEAKYYSGVSATGVGFSWLATPAYNQTGGPHIHGRWTDGDYVITRPNGSQIIVSNSLVPSDVDGRRVRVQMWGTTVSATTVIEWSAENIVLHREEGLSLAISGSDLNDYRARLFGSGNVHYDDFCFSEGFVDSGFVLDVPSDANYSNTGGSPSRTTGAGTTDATGYIDGDYWTLLESSGAGQLTRTNIPLSAGDWKVWIRYVYDNGSATADATVAITGEDSVTLGVRTGNVTGTDGYFSRNGILYGFVDAGDLTISAGGSYTMTVTGPSSSGDSLILDHIILEAQ